MTSKSLQFQIALVNRLRELPREAETIEFKSNLGEPMEIGQFLFALANTAALAGDDRAWLVWGVDNTNHAIKGTVSTGAPRKGHREHQRSPRVRRPMGDSNGPKLKAGG